MIFMTVNVAELKEKSLVSAKNILAAKGLNFANIGLSDKIKINTLCVDYTKDLKDKVADIVKNIGISERAAITILLEKEIAKIKIDTTIEVAEKTVADATETIGKAMVKKMVEAAKAATPKVEATLKFETPKVVKLDEALKTKINDNVKDVLATKGLIHPQITISDISIKFGGFHEITGVLAVAEARSLAKRLMDKTGISSERVCLVYLFEKEITHIPVVKTTEKTFSIKFEPSYLTIVVNEGNKFDFHQKAEYTAVTKVLMTLQSLLVKISKLPNSMERLKDLAEYLNNAKVKTFKECIIHTENFLKK
jgi:hypothetical protein